jgi:hypothetical protein
MANPTRSKTKEGSQGNLPAWPASNPDPEWVARAAR